MHCTLTTTMIKVSVNNSISRGSTLCLLKDQVFLSWFFSFCGCVWKEDPTVKFSHLTYGSASYTVVFVFGLVDRMRGVP